MHAYCEKRGHQPGAVLDMQTAWQLAEAWFGDCLKPDWGWKRYEQATQTFASLGLTGDFWKLDK